MKIAVIDLGSNTFNLLIAEVSGKEFCVLHSSKIGVSLGRDGIHEGKIAESAMQRALDALLEFSSVWKLFQVDDVIAIGTSAIRDAANQQDFVQRVYDKIGIQIEIVSGVEEAKLIYDGISLSVPFKHSTLIMDIGGGSTEFIRVEHANNLQITSENIGLLRIFHAVELNDPISQLDEQEIMKWLNKHSVELGDFQKCHTLIGAAGSFETFYEILNQRALPKDQTNAIISRSQIDAIIHQLIHSNQSQRDSNPYIHPIRKQMIPIAAVKVKWILERFDIQEVVISTYSLKEGVLKRFL